MQTADLIRLYPRLFHMAADGSWPSIEKHGLLSTKALLSKWEIESQESRLEQRREESRVIEHPLYGAAIVRDQKPIHEESLAEVLSDMSIAEWLDELNSRVFFFLQPERLRTLLNATSYRKDAHTVITIDTASFVAAHEARIELCAINSGFAQRHSKAARGSSTFQSIASYQHPVRSEARTKPRWDVAELCVRDSVLDLAAHVIRVDRMRGDGIVRQIA